MGFLGVMACIGLLLLAGGCGLFLGWLEKKYMKELKKKGDNHVAVR